MLTALILTYNEQIHLARCIESLRGLCNRVCVIDSHSTDRTVEIAKSLGAEVYSRDWPNNHSLQINWAIRNCSINTQWVLRIDADEYLLDDLRHEISVSLPNLSTAVSGVELNRRISFKGKFLRFGGLYPISLLRIWRNGFAKCEQRLMDEHMVVTSGEIIRLKNDFVDENLNGINWWIAKHNNYSKREALELLNFKLNFLPAPPSHPQKSSFATRIKQVLKRKVYANLPLGVRPLMYFLFRYLFRLGFIDGYRGFLFHFMQGLWYRLLVDIVVWELGMKFKNCSKIEIRDSIEYELGIKLVDLPS